MSRLITYDVGEVYRVRVGRAYENGGSSEVFLGPYQSKNTARGVATSKMRFAKPGVITHAEVQVLTGQWKVDE